MQDKTFKQLLNKIDDMLASGKSVYFDADEYDSVVEYYDQLDNIDKAKYILDIALGMHPDSELLKLRLARFMIYDKQYLDTLNYLDQNFNIYEFDLYLLKIECLLALHLYAEAYVLTQQVLKDDENEMDIILSELGYVYLETEYLKDALFYLEESLKYNSENEEVLLELILVYESEDNYSKAIEYCDKLLNINPYNADIWLLLGKLYTLEEDYIKAVDSFEFYSTIKEDDIVSMKIKAHCLLQIGRLDDAIDLLLECINISPQEDVLYFSLLDCYMELEQFNKILNIINIFEENNEKLNPILIAKKAFAYLKLDNQEKSFFFINQALEILPASIQVNILAVDIFMSMHLYSQALNACDIILQKHPNDIPILDKSVALSISLGNYDKAIYYQKRNLTITQTSESKQKLVLLYIENRNREQFIEMLNSCDKEDLLSLYLFFYNKESITDSFLSKEFLLLCLLEVYNSKTYQV